MTGFILLHAPEDRDAAGSVTAALSELQPLPLPISDSICDMQFGSTLPLVCLWTSAAQASGAAHVYRAIAERHPSACIVLRMDDAIGSEMIQADTLGPASFESLRTSLATAIRLAQRRMTAQPVAEEKRSSMNLGPIMLVGGLSALGVATAAAFVLLETPPSAPQPPPPMPPQVEASVELPPETAAISVQRAEITPTPRSAPPPEPAPAKAEDQLRPTQPEPQAEKETDAEEKSDAATDAEGAVWE